MWKMPYRPKNEISQSFNDGVVKIYSTADEAKPGYAPVEKPTLKGKFLYEERVMGFQRRYAAAQNQVEIQRVIRIPKGKVISTQDVAITEDGQQYRIDVVQTVTDVYPSSYDLTLAKLTEEIEVE